MRIIFTCFILAAFGIVSNAQRFRMTTAYSLASPQHEMNKNIQAAHGLQAGLLYQMPGKLKNLLFGFECGIATYASERIDQTFQFNSTTTAVLPVNYNSNAFNSNILARFNLIDEKKSLVPYINAKAGLYSFFSTIYIDDPNDPDGCHALKQDNIIKDKTFYWSAGGGILINAGNFAKQKKRSKVMIDLSANTIRGGTMNYINTRRLIDAQDISSPGSKPLNVQFINASTQEIHEHSVAQVYTSALEMLEFRVGLTMILGNGR